MKMGNNLIANPMGLIKKHPILVTKLHGWVQNCMETKLHGSKLEWTNVAWTHICTYRELDCKVFMN